jgi:hypothetical protein
VSALPIEERTRFAAVVEMSLEFARVRDPNLPLQSVSEMTREIVTAQDARVGTLDMDRQTISGGVSTCGGDAPAIMPIMSVLRLGLPANMLVERRSLRLRNVSSDGLGFTLLPRGYYLASIPGPPLSESPRGARACCS